MAHSSFRVYVRLEILDVDAISDPDSCALCEQCKDKIEVVMVGSSVTVDRQKTALRSF